MHLFDMLLLLLINFVEVKRLLFEVFLLSLEVLNLPVLLKFKFLRVYLYSEASKLTLNHVHVSAIRIQKVLLWVCQTILHKAIYVNNLLVNQEQSQHDLLLIAQFCEATVQYFVDVKVFEVSQKLLVHDLSLWAIAVCFNYCVSFHAWCDGQILQHLNVV